LHFGLFNLMTQRDASKAPREIYNEAVEQVRLADELDYEIAWFAEHHFSNYCLCPSPLTMATHMAAHTQRIKLGPAVIVAPLYEPVRMLEDISVLDVLSDGRAVVGFGSGYQRYEFEKFGVELAKGRDLFLETLDIYQKFIDNEALEHSGERYRIPETHFRVRPLQQRPQVYVAGLGGDPVTQRLIHERGYIPFFTTGWNTVAQMSEVREKVTRAHVEAGGDEASAPYACQMYVHVTDSKEEALKACEGARYIRRVAMAMRHEYGELDGSFLRETPAQDEPELTTMLERMVIGDVETCAQRLSEICRALRPNHISLFMQIPGIAHRSIMDSIRRFSTEVRPLLERELGPVAAFGPGDPLAA
jgi:alkanesulfonate monooxygenase SsuD/methylene tetrahydromethanopterin reductase-like flavin-dependent oxidoreductase (luciferase family)